MPRASCLPGYRDADGGAILHVETPAPVRGQGHASDLMAAIVADARQRGLKLKPVCGFAVAHFRRNGEARDVLA
ncbi:MAG: GNAT family N-acetyltransferase [Hyphomonadaceae bacterium]